MRVSQVCARRPTLPHSFEHGTAGGELWMLWAWAWCDAFSTKTKCHWVTLSSEDAKKIENVSSCLVTGKRSQRDIWKHREKGYKAGDISLQRRQVISNIYGKWHACVWRVSFSKAVSIVRVFFQTPSNVLHNRNVVWWSLICSFHSTGLEMHGGSLINITCDVL